jgi:hypothetical protein
VTVDELKQPEDEAPEREPSESEAGPEFTPILTSTVDRKWSSGGGLSRWSTLGCGAGVIVLVALLAVGVSLTRKTAWMTFERSQQRLLSAVEQRNEPSERMRTMRNLERFRTQLRIARDPYPMMGEFMRNVQGMLEDGSLGAQEVEEFNSYLESTIASGTSTP